MVELQAVGLLSPGDMGHVVGQVLIAHGLPVATCLKGRSERTRTLARKAGITAVPTYEALVRETDLILSILVPAEAVNAAQNVVSALHQTGVTTVYADCNAIAPMTAQKMEAMIHGAGSQFVSASIIGPPPRRGRVTRFYASGPVLNAFQELANYGLTIHSIGSEVAQAKGIKMVYAALTKGITAISTELLIAAQRLGLYDVLVAQFQASQAPIYQRMERSVPSMPTRSRRWVGEMEEIAKTFESLGLTPKIYQGAADLYQFVGRTALADETRTTLNRDRTLAQVIEKLAEASRATNST